MFCSDTFCSDTFCTVPWQNLLSVSLLESFTGKSNCRKVGVGVTCTLSNGLLYVRTICSIELRVCNEISVDHRVHHYVEVMMVFSPVGDQKLILSLFEILFEGCFFFFLGSF